jgi:hypothetical protein
MYFIAGLAVGSLIGFMFAWFLFSWLTAKGGRYYQSSSSKDGDLTDASVHERHFQIRTDTPMEATELARE